MAVITVTAPVPHAPVRPRARLLPPCSVEDTDTARSTRASEEAMIRDLKWLGLDWDEGGWLGEEAFQGRG